MSVFHPTVNRLFFNNSKSRVYGYGKPSEPIITIDPLLTEFEQKYTTTTEQTIIKQSKQFDLYNNSFNTPDTATHDPLYYYQKLESFINTTRSWFQTIHNYAKKTRGLFVTYVIPAWKIYQFFKIKILGYQPGITWQATSGIAIQEPTTGEENYPPYLPPLPPTKKANRPRAIDIIPIYPSQQVVDDNPYYFKAPANTNYKNATWDLESVSLETNICYTNHQPSITDDYLEADTDYRAYYINRTTLLGEYLDRYHYAFDYNTGLIADEDNPDLMRFGYLAIGSDPCEALWSLLTDPNYVLPDFTIFQAHLSEDVLTDLNGFNISEWNVKVGTSFRVEMFCVCDPIVHYIPRPLSYE